MTPVLFGVAGYPPSFFASQLGKGKDRKKAPKWLSELGLDFIELQMTYGPRMKEDDALVFREMSETYNIRFSIHASYFIVLTSNEKKVVDRSFETLAKTCNLASILGVNRIILHPGSAFKDREQSLSNFINNISHFNNEYLPDGQYIYPETAGKVNQLGSLSEIIKICSAVSHCVPCIDFAHLHARQRSLLPQDDQKKWLCTEDFVESLETLKQELSKETWELSHFHISPIEFSKKGEVRHRSYDEFNVSDTLFKESQRYFPIPDSLAQAMCKTGFPGWVVSECKDTQEVGALAMKKAYTECMNKKL